MNTRSKLLVTLFAALPLLAFAAAKTSTKPAEAGGKPAKPLHVSRGETITIQDYLTPGKTVVFDFYSDYCGPCVAVAPTLEKLHATRADIIVVKVDINRPGVKGIDWKSPVVKQFGLRSIPHFKVYGPDGKLKAEDAPGTGRAREMVLGWAK